MRISKAAANAGVGVETIRFYERRGLIEQPLKPRHGGFRDYDRAMVARIRFIRRAQQLGFSLTQIADLLALEADANADCSAVRERAREKLVEVRDKIAGLEAVSEALENIIAACPGAGPASRQCSIMSALRKEDGKEPLA